MKKIYWIVIVLLSFCLIGCTNTDKMSSVGLEYLLNEETLEYEVVSYTGTSNNVKIPDTYEGLPVTQIIATAFDDTLVVSVTFGKNIEDLGWYLFGKCPLLKEINVDNDNPYYSSVDGVLYNKMKTNLVKYPINKASKKYTIISSATNIEYFAFYKLANLQEVIIPPSIEVIDASAFKECHSLKKVSFEGNIRSIYRFAFDHCTNLESITLPAGLVYIGEYAFANCTALQNINIPKSVEILERFAFNNNPSLTIYIERTKPSSGSIPNWYIYGYKVVWES